MRGGSGHSHLERPAYYMGEGNRAEARAYGVWYQLGCYFALDYYGMG